ncbi:hypothetical protein CDAR_497511 [Caerostris darwini]|uniref:Uncharacterized protein n=1 Tax=Caerostris darwini TaxID=1538125 RepID=A0AAV4S339_9ARAC|nr:hypothetical protein CDAR_497511 [Caerostris darwini]
MNNQEAIKADYAFRERTSPIVPKHESLTIRSSQLPEANEHSSKDEHVRLQESSHDNPSAKRWIYHSSGKGSHFKVPNHWKQHSTVFIDVM